MLLDFQLAELYGVETKQLKRAVQRNIERFEGDDFMFVLDNQEFARLRCQFGTSNRGGNRYAPMAFTELGVAMLSSVLRSPMAIDINRNIMRAFVMIRQLVVENKEHQLAIEELRLRMRELEDALENNLGAVNDLSEEMRKELDTIYQAIGALSIRQAESNKPRRPIGFNTQ